MRTLLLAAGLALGLAAPAAAHRGHAVLTVVEVEPSTGATTVTHRFAAHDVEPALVTIAPKAQPSLDDPAAVQALGRYVGRAFRIGGDRGPAALKLESYAAEGDEVMLTYNAVLPTGVTAVTVDSDLFEETHPDMENQVNVRVRGVTRTLVFRPGDEAQTVDLAVEK